MRISDWSSDVCSSDLGGTKELLTNALRTCLWVDDGEVDQAIGIAPLGRIIEACRIYREGAGRDAQKEARKPQDRKSVVEGKSVSVRVDLGGRRIIKKKKRMREEYRQTTSVQTH